MLFILSSNILNPPAKKQIVLAGHSATAITLYIAKMSTGLTQSPVFSTHRRPRKICNREASNSPVVVVVPETEKSETQSKSSLGHKMQLAKNISMAHQRNAARVLLPSSGCGE